MSSGDFRCVGRGKALAYLRGDMRKAERSCLVVGPWMDDYFAEALAAAAHRGLNVRALFRPEEQVEPQVWGRMLSAASIFSERWVDFEAKTLKYLHAKCVLIDRQIAYVGSANWYRFSLEESFEVVVRCPSIAVIGLEEELEALWERGTPLRVSRTGLSRTREVATEGLRSEVIDPIAAQVLRENPKAFRLGKRKR